MSKKHKLQSQSNNDDICSWENALPKTNDQWLLKARITMLLEQGNSLDQAASICKISKHTLSLLRCDPEFEAFIDRCQARFESGHLSNINMAGQMGQWQASAWLLERLHPEKYGKKDTIRHEYEFKFTAFKKIILNIVNDLPPSFKQIFMQRLRAIDVDTEIDQVQNEMMVIANNNGSGKKNTIDLSSNDFLPVSSDNQIG